MKNKKITWITFALLLVLQLWVPASVIFHKEDVLENGKTYRFKTAPVDPNDVLRGKYVALQFDENKINVAGSQGWKVGEEVNVALMTGKDGFARIHSISSGRAPHGQDYIRTVISSVTAQGDIYVSWPFKRFYMDEFKAPLAETAYNQLRNDSTNTSYALVKVKKGNAVLENVFINDQPIDTYISK